MRKMQSIAKERKHVEHTVGQVKAMFHILDGIIPSKHGRLSESNMDSCVFATNFLVVDVSFTSLRYNVFRKIFFVIIWFLLLLHNFVSVFCAVNMYPKQHIAVEHGVVFFFTSDEHT